ncbi:hypothetical protein AK830_g4213 [Neonectria ditissima]|uniref:Metallo-beta-lactamase domain-containing protein n=1 Tax=Neonectria ditissima TaxID=78410 RepID=A0A0N8H7P7_9HYPO|nr:hypothetical protein AK830_g4213 [Neonectria ditissima]
MSCQAPPIQIPTDGETVVVKLINTVNFGPAILKRFMEPPVPGLETFQTSPSFSFLLEHHSGRKLVFDLGIRKDYDNYSQSITDYLPIAASHWHWDHIGDPSTFPATTDLVVGPGFKEAMLPGAPANPASPISESDYTGRNLREIRFDGPDALRIGNFPAFDYFGDGSFYLLDSPGHAVGHLCGLARTTKGPDTFVLLGGDVCHYAGLLRPSRYMGLPETITPHPCHPDESTSLCPGDAFEELQRSRGRDSSDTLYDMTFGFDIPLAKQTVAHLQQLDCDENIFIIIAHDSTVRDGVAHFPDSLNDWKEKGWGKGLKWAFLRDLKTYWVSKGLA